MFQLPDSRSLQGQKEMHGVGGALCVGLCVALNLKWLDRYVI